MISIVIDKFLSQSICERILSYTFSKQSQFITTTTSTRDPGYRRSEVLHNFPEFSRLISDRISQHLPSVLESLQIPPFAPSQIECQLTAHGDGCYYRVHNDNGSRDCASRVVSYAYYFFREPKGFTGGGLVLYEGGRSQMIEPENNMVVFFPSDRLHEVLPVVCLSKEFADSRFAINGWIRR